MLHQSRFIYRFNWVLLFSAVVLSVFGLLNLYSATSSFEIQDQNNYIQAQIIWTLLGMASLFIIIPIHYRHFRSLSYWFYGISVLLLMLVLVIGRKVSGHQSWLVLGPLTLQPTELAKLGFIFAMARHFSRWQSYKKANFRDLIPSILFLLIPMGLVLLQGDLGSSLFFILIYISLVLVQGVEWRLIAVMVVLVLLVCIVAYLFLLSPYQKNRIVTFMNPEMDRRGSGYHLIQSKIAVGSGGFFGKGYLKGQTHKLKFVPERHTDFIFPVLAEEWGFMGSFVVFLFFSCFLLLGIRVACGANDRYVFFLSLGIVCLFFWHLIVNLWGVLGLMPLTGVPLPFFSYGGSSLLINWIGIGLLLNVGLRRFMFT